MCDLCIQAKRDPRATLSTEIEVHDPQRKTIIRLVPRMPSFHKPIPGIS
jgi:hypothetical protein